MQLRVLFHVLFHISVRGRHFNTIWEGFLSPSLSFSPFPSLSLCLSLSLSPPLSLFLSPPSLSLSHPRLSFSLVT